MDKATIRERPERETDIARLWWNLSPHTLLPLENGEHCLLLYTGEPGGSAGPDIRDAVLCFPALKSASPAEPGPTRETNGQNEQELLLQKGTRLVGEVEFHIFASDWFLHGHHTDTRYNSVLLHIVLFLDHSTPTRRQNGTLVPTCSLLDLSPDLSFTQNQAQIWPCQQRPLPEGELTMVLLRAGLQRFEEKSIAFKDVLEETRSRSSPDYNHYDTCLLPALAEGIGYGRDRAFFHAIGLHLLGQPTHLPEPLGNARTPAPLDEQRLHILVNLYKRWKHTGLWQPLRDILLQKKQSVKSLIKALQALFSPLSQARTDILICNIVLPFAAAVADLEKTTDLVVQARHIYLAYPALTSNRITRTMSEQLLLPLEPGQACLQQGLHHIYRQTCRAKQCQDCPCQVSITHKQELP